jgi:hypothetical protein
VPGARIVAGTLWLAGPAGTLYAVAAETVARIGSRERGLSQAEYDLARRVFADALPPRDDMRITNTIGGGGRAFVWIRPDGKITVNMGDGYDDPLTWEQPSRKYGEVFIHELVHAWQIHHSPNLPFVLSGVLARLSEPLGNNPYKYELGKPWGDYNVEQQGNIVSDWFVRHFNRNNPADNHGLDSPAAIRDPAYRYINGYIRIGRT